MELIVVGGSFVKMVCLTLLIYYIYIKIMDCNDKNKNKTIFIVINSINIALLYIFLIKIFNPLGVILILFMIYAGIIKYINSEKFNYMAYIVSCTISYAIYLIAIIISGITLKLCIPNLKSKNAISLLTIPASAVLLFNGIFKIKRLNKGVNFFRNMDISKNIVKCIIGFSIIITVFYGILQNDNARKLNKFLMVGSIVFFLSIIIWIKSQITKTYKSKMRDRTIEIQKTEIDEKSKLIEEIKAENLKLASAVHKYNKKISALEFAMKNVLKLETNTEFANEIYTILEETKEASKNFAKETEVNNNKLPLTNIPGIDNMFKYMQEEARKNDINFDLKLNTSINPLIETSISKDKFETLIGDHLKDAIIAVNASSESYKSILVTLGLVDGIYELSIHDTGIEFEIETLLKLGQEQITTHKDEGGSGIGFMTTFETLKECKASLIIEEYNPETTNYTKTVTVRFDGRNEYKIISYRAEEIKKQNNGRKIIVEKLK